MQGDPSGKVIRPAAFVPARGHAWNPLRKYPRNNPCICGSGDKFKSCCSERQPRAIPVEWAEKITANWDRILKGAVLIQPPPESKPKISEDDKREIQKMISEAESDVETTDGKV